MIKFEMLNSKAKTIDHGDLNIANFERKVNKKHLGELKQAVLNGDLQDNVITVLKKEGHYDVIDGQHRLMAVQELHKEDPSFSYKLILRVLEGDALNAYLCINKGKPLSANDYTKAIDDGYNRNVPFFNELREYCTHYGSTNKVKYSTALSCYSYAIKEGFLRTLRKEDYSATILNIQRHDLIKLKSFMYDYKLIFGKDVREWYYRKIIMANLMKIYFNNFTKIVNFQKFMKKIAKDQWLKHNSVIYNTDAFIETYMYIERTYIKNK